MDETGDATPDYSLAKPGPQTDTPVRPAFPCPEDQDDFHSSSSDGEPEESFCNPEPPLDLLESSRDLFTADNIGDTVYSKHWLFTTLMDLIKAVENQASSRDGSENNAGFDLDENLQDELCKLWDMSMNEAVVSFLLEFKVSEILTGILERSKSPRATEICLGILGNMCCNMGAAAVIASNEKLVNLILMHLNETDTPTLVETMRCLHTCVSSETVKELWCDAVRDEPTIYDNSRFILQSSTNGDLLKNASQFIDEIMDVDERICVAWSTKDMALAVVEAINQFGIGHNNDLNCLFHILQLLSTNENGVAALVSEADVLSKVCLRHLVNACDDEIVGVLGRENFFASLFSVFNTILTACEVGRALVMKDYQLMRCLLKTLDVVYPTVNKDSGKDVSRRYRRRRTTSSGHDSPEGGQGFTSEVNGKKAAPPSGASGEGVEDEYNEKMLMLLYEIMQSLLTDVIDIVCAKDASKESEENNGSQNKSKAENDSSDAKTNATKDKSEASNASRSEEPEMAQVSRTVAATLSYLNDQCSRERLYFLVWSLSEKKNRETARSCLEQLHSAAKEHSCERLSRILAAAQEFL